MSIRNTLVIWLALFVALLISGKAHAGPVLKIDVVLEQADGSKFIARPYGDEWHNGYETKDGYTILFDERTGNWSYADRAADGALVATGMIVNNDMPTAPKQLRAIPVERPGNNLLQRSFIEEGPARPATGNQRVLVLLVQFANRALMTSEAQWANLIFGTAFSNVRHYYREVSYNHLDLIPATESYGTANDGVVVVTLPYNHPNTGGNLGDTNSQIVKDALIAADPYVDFAAFDDDGNGYISSDELHIVVVVAGYEAAYGGAAASCSPNVSAHASSLGGTVPAPILDGKSVGSSAGKGKYTQQGEWHCNAGDNPGHMAPIGGFVHELGHSLWLPDEYDTDHSSEGIGDWGLMGGGSWNTCSGGYPGNCPSHPTAWDKWYLTWLTPTQITGTQTVSIPDVTTNPTVFQLRDNPGGVDWSKSVTSGTGEYFLVENRQKIGYNAGLPGSGLLIWHIWEGASSATDANQNEGGRRLIDLREADGLNHLDLGANRGDAGDPFPGTSNNTVFDDTSNPSSRLYCSSGIGFCDPSGVSITGMSASGATMTATMAVGISCTYSISPTGRSFSASGGTGNVSVTTQNGCSWTAVSNASWIIITSNSGNTGSGTVTYSVAANASTSLRTGTMSIASRTFTLSQDGANVLLNSTLQSGSITGTSSQSTWVYYYVDLPLGATNLIIDLYNLSGDANLYVRSGSEPSLSAYDCGSWNGGTTSEQCRFSTPSSGRWWIGVNNYAIGTISYTIKATWTGTSPNLTPYKPASWSDRIVVSKTTGTNTDSLPFYTTDTLYVDWAVINNGTGATSATFYTRLYVDTVEKQSWYTPPPLNVNYYLSATDYSIGTLSAGTHTIKIVADSTNAIGESNEADNEYTKTIRVFEGSCLNLPVRRAGASYNALQDAYNGAADGDTIQSQADFFSENLDFSRNISVSIMGGYDCNYLTNVQKSVVNGTVTIRGGSVTMENIIIR